MQSRAKRGRVFVWRERRKQMLGRSFSLLLKRKQATMQFSPLVRKMGVEPTRCYSQAPETCASAIPPLPHNFFNFLRQFYSCASFNLHTFTHKFAICREPQTATLHPSNNIAREPAPPFRIRHF